MERQSEKSLCVHGSFQPPHMGGMHWIKWEQSQPSDKEWMVGDVVRCRDTKALCVISEVRHPSKDSGWPTHYAIRKIPGLPYPNKHAWYCYLDFELVEPSAARKFAQEAQA